MASVYKQPTGAGFTLGAAADFSQGIASLGGAYAQGQALRAQAAYQSKIADINSKLADWQANDATARGAYQGNQKLIQGNEVANSARAAYAGGSIDVNSGTALDVQNRSRAVSAMDALTIANNAAREAFGIKVNAINASAQSQFMQSANNQAATNSLISGGLSSLAYGLKGADVVWGNGSQTKTPAWRDDNTLDAVNTNDTLLTMDT